MREMENSLEAVLTRPILKSAVMETEPVDVSEDQQWYLNKIVSGFFEGTPQELLKYTQSVEIKLGRLSKKKREPRTADIDILIFDEIIVNDADLKIPHPAITQRRFCLEGLYEIMPDQVIAGLNLPVHELVRQMSLAVRQQKIKKIASG